MHIILTDPLNILVLVVPIVPANTTVTMNGAYNDVKELKDIAEHIEGRKSRTIGWTSIFPVNKDYPFQNKWSIKNGWVYVEFIKLMEEYMLPLRVIYTTNNHIPVLNMLAKISQFNYTVDKTGDINYTISLTEFPETFFQYFGAEKAEDESTEIKRAKKIWEMINKDYEGFKNNMATLTEKGKEFINKIKGLAKKYNTTNV